MCWTEGPWFEVLSVLRFTISTYASQTSFVFCITPELGQLFILHDLFLPYWRKYLINFLVVKKLRRYVSRKIWDEHGYFTMYP